MNIGGIKAFLGGEESVRPETKINEQLQAEGLKQARQGQQTAIVGTLSSQYAIAYKALGDSLRQNTVVDGKVNNKSEPAPESRSGDKPLFDFEAIAENVLNFVGGVIRGAAKNGADEATLTDLFSQAREGVGRGIGLAKQDLSGFLNDDISAGIDNAERAIFSGIDDLENDVFAPVSSQGVQESLSVSSFRGSQLLIRTRDGDEVSLSFSASRSFSFQQQSFIPQNTSDTAGDQPAQENSNSYLSYIENLGISLTINGSLDEDELRAISDLVSQIADLADEFFNGDIQKAFQQSLELGFDRDELVGYALELNKVQSASVVKAYEDVQQFTDSTESQERVNSAQPVLQYVDEMLRTIDRSSELLGGKDDYDNIVSEIVNQLDEEVKTPDLLSAINRFHQFNNQIVDSASTFAANEQSS